MCAVLDEKQFFNSKNITSRIELIPLSFLLFLLMGYGR